ncbi:MAG: LysR family transcriptional regulator [Oculatellaceae cyanobacterium bins.114]|nr:LysR family transcriptional regulator [Oculatellaceae cyanobacterium bins.114]
MREVNRDGVKLSQLRALVTVAEHGNFSEAALHLAVSQSAISHAIASLEQELGVILLSRGRHGARLTPVGERITQHAQEMLQLLDTIGKEANRSKGLQGGEVRISCFRSVATHVLPEIMAEFRSAYPAIAITLNEYRGNEGGYDGIEQSLREGKADIGFTCLPPSPEFDTQELMRDEYVVLCPPQWAIPHSLCWDDIRNYPIILPPDDDYCSVLIRNHFNKLIQPLNALYKIKEDSTIVSMVSQGLGITVMARLAAEPLPPEIQVRRLPVPLDRIINVVTLTDALHPPAVYAFLETLKRVNRSPHHPPQVSMSDRLKTA